MRPPPKDDMIILQHDPIVLYNRKRKIAKPPHAKPIPILHIMMLTSFHDMKCIILYASTQLPMGEGRWANHENHPQHRSALSDTQRDTITHDLSILLIGQMSSKNKRMNLCAHRSSKCLWIMIPSIVTRREKQFQDHRQRTWPYHPCTHAETCTHTCFYKMRRKLPFVYMRYNSGFWSWKSMRNKQDKVK